MASADEYMCYKRDTKCLLQWIIQTSNGIICSCCPDFDQDDEPKVVNTTGKSTVSGLESMAKLITKFSAEATPEFVLGLLRSVIDARKKAWQHYQHSPSTDEGAESDRAHKHFIGSLETIFQTLGGKEWETSLKDKRDKGPALEDGGANDDGVQNRFATLDISAMNASSDDTSTANEENEAKKCKKKNHVRDRKHKSKRAGKQKSKQKIKRQKATTQNIPLDNYAIIREPDSVKFEYYTAASSLARNMAGIRWFVQRVWKSMVEARIRAPVGGAFCTMTVAKVKQLEFHTLLDFPGHESYESVVDSLSAQNPAFLRPGHDVYMKWPTGTNEDGLGEYITIDSKEYYMIHTHHALGEFVIDFQKAKTGTPTKAMRKRLRDWDPYFDAVNASKREQQHWRIQYTIKWLYELVNMFLMLVTGRKKAANEAWDVDEVDWSPDGPWHKTRRLFGLNEFAAQVASWAMRRQGSEFRKQVHPHHVFQLQCAVDSFTISQGWLMSHSHEYTFERPLYDDYDPLQDTRFMLHKEEDLYQYGLVNMLDGLIDGGGQDAREFGQDLMLDFEPQHPPTLDPLWYTRNGLSPWLGEHSNSRTILGSGLTSQFMARSVCNPWRWSPYLSAAALTEGLEMMHNDFLSLWDDLPNALILMHLYNMLLRRGHLTEDGASKSCLYTMRLFCRDVFGSDTPPESDFVAQFDRCLARFQRGFGRKSVRRRRATDIHELRVPKDNVVFTTRPLPSALRQVFWNVENVPDRDLPLSSCLAAARIAGTPRYVDAETGKVTFAESNLLKRVGDTRKKEVCRLADYIWHHSSAAVQQSGVARMGESVAFDKGIGSHDDDGPSLNVGQGLLFNGFAVMEMLLHDLHVSVEDMNTSPLALNMPYHSQMFEHVVANIEGRLQETKNPLWMQLLAQSRQNLIDRRIALIRMALMGNNEECLKIMAGAFLTVCEGVPQAASFLWMRNYPENAPKRQFSDFNLDEELPPWCSVM